MGYGDDIMATGLARGLKQQGKRAAFGDGRSIIWGPWSEEMFRHNPNVAHPGSERDPDLVWIDHYKGSRKYNKLVRGKWVWNYDFKATPGEFFFDQNELDYAKAFGDPFIVIEPNVPWQKKVASNKDWGGSNYQQIASELTAHGHRVVQFTHINSRRELRDTYRFKAPNFRSVIAALSRASLYIGPEGGLHHAAAAVGTPAVVLMGGFIPPAIVGYDTHTNLTGGATACGNIEPCVHCRDAMSKIAPIDVLEHAARYLR